MFALFELTRLRDRPLTIECLFMTRPRLVAIALLTCLVAADTRAFPPEHGPFAPGEAPPAFPLAQCPVISEEGPKVVVGRKIRTYGAKGALSPRLRAIAADYLGGIVVEIVDAQGRTHDKPRWVSDYPPDGRPDSAWCADVNGDGEVDFVLPLWGHGNGLGALAHQLIVALSAQSGYRTWVMPTMAPDSEDVVKVSNQCVIVKATFVNNNDRNESRRHSYWVYDLVAVRGDRLSEANGLDNRFPKWVWYTAKPNHSASRLSASEKERILRQSEEALFWEAQP